MLYGSFAGRWNSSAVTSLCLSRNNYFFSCLDAASRNGFYYCPYFIFFQSSDLLVSVIIKNNVSISAAHVAIFCARLLGCYLPCCGRSDRIPLISTLHRPGMTYRAVLPPCLPSSYLSAYVSVLTAVLTFYSRL